MYSILVQQKKKGRYKKHSLFSLSILPFNTRHLLEIGISFCQHGICFFQSEILHSFNFPKRNFFYSYFMLPKIWKIRVYEPISKFFWDLIPPQWIIRILFYKIFRHIIFRKFFCLSQHVKFRFFLLWKIEMWIVDKKKSIFNEMVTVQRSFRILSSLFFTWHFAFSISNFAEGIFAFFLPPFFLFNFYLSIFRKKVTAKR